MIAQFSNAYTVVDQEAVVSLRVVGPWKRPPLCFVQFV